MAFEYIRKDIASGGELAELQTHRILNNLLNTERGQKIVSAYAQSRKKFIEQLDLDLRAELQNMICIDQRYNSTKFQDSIFLVNDKRLVEIFVKYGYPYEKLIGRYNIDQIPSDPRILLLHTDDSIRTNYFIPKIKKLMENGKCSPYVLGTLFDNLALFNEQPQTHGTYFNGKGGYAKMIPDKSKVNANRKSIGLPSMEIAKRLDSLKRQYFESH